MTVTAAARYLLLAGGSGSSSATGLHGRLVAKRGIFYDDTGPRLPQFFTAMPLIRVYNDSLPRFRDICQAGVAAGRHGIRFGAPLVESEDQDGGFWRGCHVSPEMALDLIPAVMTELANFGLYAHIFGAYRFPEPEWPAERQFKQNFCQRIATKKELPVYVALDEWRNEFNLTSPWGLSQESYNHGAEAMSIARNILGCICTMGSPGEDDGYIAGTITNGQYWTNDNLIAPSIPPGFRGDVAGLDFGRGLSGGMMVRHIDRAYYDGRYHGKYKGASLWDLEPDGMNDGGRGDVFDPEDDPAFLFAYHMRQALDGMAVSFLNGPAIRCQYPIETGYGFNEFPKFIRDFFPQDIGEWEGPTWMVKGDEFITVCCEEWGFIGPPSNPLRVINGRVIKTWKVLFYDGKTIEGTGPIVLEPGFKAAAVKGTF